MTIANLKEFIAKFSESRQNDNDGGAGNDEIEEILEELGGKPASNPDIDIPDLYGPCIPDEKVDEPTANVYGPCIAVFAHRRDNHDEPTANVYGHCIPDENVDEPTAKVYGPPSWYDDDEDLDICSHDAENLIDQLETQ